MNESLQTSPEGKWDGYVLFVYRVSSYFNRFLQRQASAECVTTPSPVSTVPAELMEETEDISRPTNVVQTDPVGMDINDDVAMESDDDPPKSKPSIEEYHFPAHPISYFPQDTPSTTTQVEPPTLEPATSSMMADHPPSLEPATSSMMADHPPNLEPATSSMMADHPPSLELAASRSEAFTTRDQPTTSAGPVATVTSVYAVSG